MIKNLRVFDNLPAVTPSRNFHRKAIGMPIWRTVVRFSRASGLMSNGAAGQCSTRWSRAALSTDRSHSFGTHLLTPSRAIIVRLTQGVPAQVHRRPSFNVVLAAIHMEKTLHALT